MSKPQAGLKPRVDGGTEPCCQLSCHAAVSLAPALPANCFPQQTSRAAEAPRSLPLHGSPLPHGAITAPGCCPGGRLPHDTGLAGDKELVPALCQPFPWCVGAFRAFTACGCRNSRDSSALVFLLAVLPAGAARRGLPMAQQHSSPGPRCWHPLCSQLPAATHQNRILQPAPMGNNPSCAPRP